MIATIEQARDTLHAKYQGEPWYRRTELGTATDGTSVLCVVVATGRDRYRGVRTQWEGFKVLVRVERRPEDEGRAA